MFKRFFNLGKFQKAENELILKYFAECMKTINRDNLYMLRKACMYTAWGAIFMPILGTLIVPGYKINIGHLLLIVLIIVYYNINRYTREHEWEISTNATGTICGLFYFALSCIFVYLDVTDISGAQAIWTPMLIVLFPMLYIDRMYKYGMEELAIIIIFGLTSFYVKPYDIFTRDMYMVLAAYVLSMLSAHIILAMRSSEGLAMQELKKSSSLDKLTHVLNKGALLQKIDDFYENREPYRGCAMCVIDLDDFKQVNDNLGHSTGDLLLERVGQLLIDSFRAYDIIGRYGGDEFVVFMPNMEDIATLQMRCRTLQMFLTDFSVGNGKPFSVSIGAIIDRGNNSADEAFRMADDALYKSKLDGKNCCTTWQVETSHKFDKPVLLGISGRKKTGMEYLYTEEQGRFEILSAFTENNALCYISQYHRQIKLIVLEMDVDEYGSEKILRYIKTRAGFVDIPVLAVASSEASARTAKELGANAALTFDTENEIYKDAINQLVGM